MKTETRRCHQCHTYGCSNYDQCQDTKAKNRILNGSHSDGIFPELNKDSMPFVAADRSQIVNPKGQLIAEVWCDRDRDYIVRAVNSHEELLGAIWNVMGDSTWRNTASKEFCGKMDDLMKAYHRAEGK